MRAAELALPFELLAFEPPEPELPGVFTPRLLEDLVATGIVFFDVVVEGFFVDVCLLADGEEDDDLAGDVLATFLAGAGTGLGAGLIAFFIGAALATVRLVTVRFGGGGGVGFAAGLGID